MPIYDVFADFGGDVAAALAGVPAGAQLYCPSAHGPYIPPAAAGWDITKPIEIFSDGPGVPEASCFQYYGSLNHLNANSTVFNIKSSDVYLHDLVISNNAGPPALGTGDAVTYGANVTYTAIRIERCKLNYAGRNAIRLAGQNLNGVTISDTTIYGCQAEGIYANNINSVQFSNVIVQECKLAGIHLVDVSNAALDSINSESNGTALTDPVNEGLLILERCQGIFVGGANIEGFDALQAKNGIVLKDCRSVEIAGCQTNNNNSPGTAGTVGIRLVGACLGNIIGSNNLFYCEHAVLVSDILLSIGNVIFPQSVVFGTTTTPGKVTLMPGGRNFAFATNLTGGVADNKGVGLLLPSMPGVVNIDTSVIQDGLEVFDSTAGQRFARIAGVWRTMTDDAYVTLPNNATPSVLNGRNFKCSPAGNITITSFTNGVNGQTIRIIFTNMKATLNETGNIRLGGTGTSFSPTADDVMAFTFDGTNWYEVSRSLN